MLLMLLCNKAQGQSGTVRDSQGQSGALRDSRGSRGSCQGQSGESSPRQGEDLRRRGGTDVDSIEASRVS